MNKKLKTLITLFFMGTAFSLIYALPFVQYVFYDALIEALQSTNAQLGILIAIFGIGNIAGAPFGGWLSDKVNCKIIYIVALIGNSALCFAFANNLNYSFAVFIWIGLAIVGLFAFFPAHIKLVRLLADEENQGKIFGLSESAAGIGSVLINAVALYLFSRCASDVLGLKGAIIGYGVLGLLCTVILWFLIESPKKAESTNEKEKISAKDFLVVIKYPGTWFAGFAIFTTYTLYVSLSYFTPYFTNVLGVSVAFAGSIAIIRTYGIRFLGAPIGGALGDKFNSVSKILRFSFIAAIVIILIFMKLPATTSVGIIIGLTLILSLFTYMARGAMFAVPAEVKSPKIYAATTAGITCAIGYSPDLFQFTLFGNWLDKYGDLGYRYIFIYTLIVLVIGITSTTLTLIFKKKNKFNLGTSNENAA